MSGRKQLSPRAALGLMAVLCLLFAAALLLSASGGAEEPLRVDAAAVGRERLLTGGDEQPRTALELLPGEKLELNTATAEELQKLPGIGDVLSQAIVDHRQEHGPFQSVEELLQVPGIGEKRLDAIRDLVTVEPEG